MVTDDFYYRRNIDSKEEWLNQMNPDKKYTKAETDSAMKKLSEFTTAFYETAQYMIMNNK
jgi:hypothetical protein